MTALSDLRAAVARADEVLGCGAMPGRFKETTGQTTNGRCVCLDHPRAGHVLAAVYKAAKAAVEEDEDQADIEVAEKRLAEIEADSSQVIRMTPQEIADFDAEWLEPVKAEDVLPSPGDTVRIYQPNVAPPVSPETELVFEFGGKAYHVRGRVSDIKYTCHNGVESASRWCKCPKCETGRVGSNEPGQDGSAYK